MMATKKKPLLEVFVFEKPKWTPPKFRWVKVNLPKGKPKTRPKSKRKPR